ncbi:MAG: SDR family oxidoreductase [Acetobacteraceae bacterium]|nr:SDR family oxidoreductase [Acetobacteraceae bacterium]
MRILLIGASGFIGSRITAELLSRGHSVTCASRSPERLQRRFPYCDTIRASFADTTPTWLAHLVRIDAVVNAAGVLRGDLQGVHYVGPVALFNACVQAGIPRVLQISALGAGEQSAAAFLSSKDAADQHLLHLVRECDMPGWCVLRPSLVIGRGGASTALFCALAAAPFPLRLGSGHWRVQPIHIADLARVVATLMEQRQIPPLLAAVGPDAMSTDELTMSLRLWLGLRPRRFISIPEPLLKLGGLAGDCLPEVPLTTESLAMLARGNTADAEPLAAALGWRPRRLVEALVTEPATKADRWLARMLPLRPLLSAALFAVWIGSGTASLAIAPARARALLSGLTSDFGVATTLTWSGAALDLALGFALLARSWRRSVLQAQLAVMLTYTVLATVALPSLWADPFGSLLKNLSVLAATLVLLAIED